jgi:arylsulfatase A-like enzyme
VPYIVLDDVGFSALESYGGTIQTPNIKRIADRGLMYTNFHTTALCSPTRSGSRTTPFPAAGVTSCGRSARRCTGFLVTA